MGIFTRFKDIVSANLNSMLDKAEDPEKMVKLMIREMEDTLVELKASCAGVMADVSRVGRELAAVREQEEKWSARASLAVDKGRDDLAREALLEKTRLAERAGGLDDEAIRLQAMVDQYQEDIATLEDKLKTAKEKQRLLVQRHIRADVKRKAHADVRRAESEDAVRRFEEFERRIERMEAEANLVAPPRRTDLDTEFSHLEGRDDIENQLQALKARLGK